MYSTLNAQGSALQNGTYIFYLVPKIDLIVQLIQNLNSHVQSSRLFCDNFLDLRKTACSVRLPKGEDEFKLNFPCFGFEYEVQ